VPPFLPTFTRQVPVLPALIATTHRPVSHECDLDRLCVFASVRRGTAAIVQGVVFTLIREEVGQTEPEGDAECGGRFPHLPLDLVGPVLRLGAVLG
jgi:hypothetical protein